MQSGLLGLPFQFWNFGLAATNKITAASIETPSAQALSGVTVMMGLGYLISMLKAPDYVWDKMTLEDKLARSLDQSGATGLLMDMAYRAQGAGGSATGVNMLPFDYQYGAAPSAGDAAFDWLGAGPGVARNAIEGGYVGLTEGEWNQMSWAAPLRNFWLTRWLYDDLVEAASEPARRPSTPSRI